MKLINSNVEGKLENLSKNQDGTFLIKILGVDGNFHIYNNLKKVTKSLDIKVGDVIGESEELFYTIKQQMSKI